VNLFFLTGPAVRNRTVDLPDCTSGDRHTTDNDCATFRRRHPRRRRHVG
jgi:hypothetical protein